jgi:hypothetical protein
MDNKLETIICEPATVYIITLVDHGIRHYLHADAKPRDSVKAAFTPFPLSAQKFHDLRVALNYSNYFRTLYPNLPECKVMRMVLHGEIFDDVSVVDVALAE